MKKRFLAAVLALAMLLMMVPSAFAASDGFDDVPGHWAEDAINRWSGYGVVNGVGDNQFAPNGTLTRAQAAQVFANLLDLEVQADISRYTDVPEGSWYHTAIAQCVAAGILTGTGGATMDPQSPVTREELFVMFARALNIRPQSSSDVTFGDSGEVSGWAQGYINALADRGFVSGVGGGMLAPGEAINRASVMSLLDKTISDYANTSGTTVGNASGVVLVVADNVSVAGDVDTLVVYGGSASVTGSQVAEATVAGENASLSVSGSAVVERVDVAGAEAVLTLTGSVRAGQVTVSGESAQVSLSGQAQAASVAVEETAAGAGLTVGAGSAVTTVDSAAANVTISGSGTVETANVSGNNTTVNTDGTDLTVSQGTTGVTENDKPVSGGTTVETQPEQPVTPPIYIPNYYTVTFVDTDKEMIVSQTVVEHTTDLSGLAPEVKVEAGQQLKWHNGTSYVELSEVTVTSNLTLTAVVGSNDFTAGNGTETYPYLISNADEFSAIFAGSSDSDLVYYELNDDIDLSSSNRAGASLLVNAVLDGNGHKIYSSTENNLFGVFNESYGTARIANLTYELTNLNSYSWEADCSPLIYQVGGDCNITIENVSITGSHSVDSNNGPFVMNEFMTSNGKLTLRDCEYAATMQGNGYNSCFIGWQGAQFTGSDNVTEACEGATITFENCTISGSMVCNRAAVFVANGSNAYKRNYVFTNNEITGTVRGTDAVGYFTAVSTKDEPDYETAAKQSCNADDENVYVGANDTTLAISSADNGTLTITASDNENVTSYMVEVGLYTTLYKDGQRTGTWKYFVRQTIPTGDSMTVDILNTGFVDYDYCTANQIEVTEDALGNDVATINGTTYYVIQDYIDDVGNQGYVGTPTVPTYKDATLVNVVAYVGDEVYSSAKMS